MTGFLPGLFTRRNGFFSHRHLLQQMEKIYGTGPIWMGSQRGSREWDVF